VPQDIGRPLAHGPSQDGFELGAQVVERGVRDRLDVSRREDGGGRVQRGTAYWKLGRNEEAARYSGIGTRKIISSAYVLSGLLAGITGVLMAFYTNSISPSSHGNFYELYAIAAAVLGGCSLRGGEGSVIGIVIGTALLQVLQNLVNLLGIPSSLNFAVMGTVILIGVVADELVRQRSARKRIAK